MCMKTYEHGIDNHLTTHRLGAVIDIEIKKYKNNGKRGKKRPNTKTQRGKQQNT